jgi:hypothetical protein
MAIQPPCHALHTFPSDVQRLVLVQLDQPDLGRLRETCQGDKTMVDRHQPALLKDALLDEGPKLKALIDEQLVIVKGTYDKSCQWSTNARASDSDHDHICKVFNRFKAKCQKLLPEIPSKRAGSSGLLFQILNQHPFMEEKRGHFEGSFKKNCKIRKESYDLLSIDPLTATGTRALLGACAGKVYNLQIMSEFVDKVFEVIPQFRVT